LILYVRCEARRLSELASSTLLEVNEMSEKIQESFAWAGNIEVYKESFDGDPNARLYKGKAITVTITGNQRRYTEHELQLAARSLSERPLSINHTVRLAYPENRTLDCEFESQAVEYLALVRDPMFHKMFDAGEIDHTSIEGRARRVEELDGIQPIGVVFTGLSFVTKGTQPGDPETTIEAVSETISEVPLSELVKEDVKTEERQGFRGVSPDYNPDADEQTRADKAEGEAFAARIAHYLDPTRTKPGLVADIKRASGQDAKKPPATEGAGLDGELFLDGALRRRKPKQVTQP
jgi:hypothetical protein